MVIESSWSVLSHRVGKQDCELVIDYNHAGNRSLAEVKGKIESPFNCRG